MSTNTPAKGRVTLDVGGRLFSTTWETLCSPIGCGYFTPLRTHWAPADRDVPLFLDRDSDHFATILAYLRSGYARISGDADELLAEAVFYECASLIHVIEMRRTAHIARPIAYVAVPEETGSVRLLAGNADGNTFVAVCGGSTLLFVSVRGACTLPPLRIDAFEPGETIDALRFETHSDIWVHGATGAARLLRVTFPENAPASTETLATFADTRTLDCVAASPRPQNRYAASTGHSLVALHGSETVTVTAYSAGCTHVRWIGTSCIAVGGGAIYRWLPFQEPPVSPRMLPLHDGAVVTALECAATVFFVGCDDGSVVVYHSTLDDVPLQRIHCGVVAPVRLSSVPNGFAEPRAQGTTTSVGHADDVLVIRVGDVLRGMRVRVERQRQGAPAPTQTPPRIDFEIVYSDNVNARRDECLGDDGVLVIRGTENVMCSTIVTTHANGAVVTRADTSGMAPAILPVAGNDGTALAAVTEDFRSLAVWSSQKRKQRSI